MKGKRLKLVLAVLLGTVLAIGLSGPTLAATTDNNGPERYIVLFDTGVNEAAKANLEQKFSAVVGKDIALLGNANLVWIPPRAVEAFSNRAEVVRLEEDVVVYALAKPENPGKPPKGEPQPQPVEELPWGVDRIDADLVWNSDTGSGVKVAVIDTGIDGNHLDLAANLAGGVNFVASGKGAPWARIADPTRWDDDNGHGTHVAGTIAGVDNEIGVLGVAPGASLYAVKVLDKTGSGYLSDVISGIEWAINNNMDVINMSLGSSSDVQALHDASDAAFAAGIVVVAAAGNDYGGPVIYPAAYGSVIAVSATDSSNSLAGFSSVGAEVELAAPGVGILSTWNDGYYNTISGTSMAAPHVTGTVALVLSVNPNLTPVEVRTILHDTAEDLGTSGQDSYYGYGLVDAEAAVNITP